jgi:hypothetical protein
MSCRKSQRISSPHGQWCQHHRCRDDRARPCGRRLPDVTALIAALVVPEVAMACSTSFFNSPRVIITRPDLTAISNMRRTRPGIARPSSSIVRNCSMSIQILKASLVGGSRRTHTVPGRRLRSDGMATSRCPAMAERLASVRGAVNRGPKLKLVHQLLAFWPAPARQTHLARPVRLAGHERSNGRGSSALSAADLIYRPNENIGPRRSLGCRRLFARNGVPRGGPCGGRVVVGLPVGDIYIRGIGEGNGGAQIGGAENLSFIDRIAVCFAGIEAGNVFQSPQPSWAGNADCRMVFGLLMGMPEEHAEWLGARGAARASELLAEHRSKVIRLAERLVEVCQVDAAEFMRLMSA